MEIDIIRLILVSFIVSTWWYYSDSVEKRTALLVVTVLFLAGVMYSILFQDPMLGAKILLVPLTVGFTARATYLKWLHDSKR